MAGSEVLPGDRPGTFVLRMDGMDQSYVDLDDPTRLVFDYVRRIADVIDAVGEPGAPLRVVHVGGAGLTLPRYVAATRPRSSQVVLEPDAEQTELVRREIPLPPRCGIRVRPVDGLAGVAQLRDDSADVVVLDAYADAVVPEELVGVGFLGEVARVLGPGGLLAANLVDQAPFPRARRAIAGMRTLWPDVALTAEPSTLRGRRAGNLVVVAGAVVPVEALRAAVAREVAPHRVLDARAVSDSFGGGRPL